MEYYDFVFHSSEFPFPVITGIGHEKDDTIIDLVAHTRLKTPTAVAEFFINGAESFYERLVMLEEALIEHCNEILSGKKEELENYAASVQRVVTGFVAENHTRLLRKGNALQQGISNFEFRKKHELNTLAYSLLSTLSVWKIRQDNLLESQRTMFRRKLQETLLKEHSELRKIKAKVKNALARIFYKEQERIRMNENTARLLNPVNVLTRGYTLTLKEGRIIKSAGLLGIDDEIETCFADGNVKSKIINNKYHVNKENKL